MKKTYTLIISILITIACLLYSSHAQSLEFAIPDNAKDGEYVSYDKFTADRFTTGEVTRFMFDGWEGPAIPVWAYVPTGVDLTTAPVLVVMHGNQRNPARYLIQWQPFAEEKGIIAIAPEFARKDFPGSAGYNLGNVFKRDSNVLQDEAIWSFSAIEPLFDYTVSTLQSEIEEYYLYGHSAGSQFVHRFMYYKPDARVIRYLAANAGWYTLPDFTEEYPYGLNGARVSESALKNALSEDVIILLGDQDIQTDSSSLRRTPEAMRQGEHRYNRGVNFYFVGQEQAELLGIDFGWKSIRVKDVGHSNAGMAEAAAFFID